MKLYVHDISMKDGSYEITYSQQKTGTLTILQKIYEIELVDSSHAEMVERAAKEIFGRYKTKQQKPLNRLRAFFSRFVSKLTHKEDPTKKRYEAISACYQQILGNCDDKKVVCEQPAPISLGDPTKKPVKAISDSYLEKLCNEEKKVASEPPAAFSLKEGAYLLKKESEIVSFELGEEEARSVLSRDAFSALYRDKTKTVRDLIFNTLKNGFPSLDGTPDQKRHIDALRMILFRLKEDISSKDLKVSSKAKRVEERLAKAFTDCQAVQTREVMAIYNELLDRGTLGEALSAEWQSYKETQFDLWIMERHPETLATAGLQQWQEFPHLKSGYLSIFGEALGLLNVEAAKRDTHQARQNYVLISSTKEQVIQDFKERLKAGEFIGQICSSINNDKEDALVTKFGKSIGNESFGFYDPSKSYSYSEGGKTIRLAPPSEDQSYSMKPYISPREVALALEGIISVD